MTRLHAAIGIGAIVVGLSACGSSRSPSRTVAGTASVPSVRSTSATSTLTSAASSSAAPAVKVTAQAVLARLMAADLPITGVATVTAANDPNHLLGRPNGYSSKVTFIDTRVDKSSVADPEAGSVDLGGAIECYDNPADAVRRAAYIQQVEKDNPVVGTEYTYVVGPAVIRISSALTPTQAAAYKTAAG